MPHVRHTTPVSKCSHKYHATCVRHIAPVSTYTHQYHATCVRHSTSINIYTPISCHMCETHSSIIEMYTQIPNCEVRKVEPAKFQFKCFTNYWKRSRTVDLFMTGGDISLFSTPWLFYGLQSLILRGYSSTFPKVKTIHMNQVLRIELLFDARFFTVAVETSQTAAHSTSGIAICCHVSPTTHPFSSLETTYVRHHR